MEEKLEKIVQAGCYDKLLRMTKEVLELKVENLDDAKKMAQLLESGDCLATYAVTNTNSATFVLIRI